MSLQAISSALLQRSLPPSAVLLSRHPSLSCPQRRRTHLSLRTMASGKEVIQTEEKALGPYSPGIKAGNTLYISGQIGLKPGTKDLADGIEDQAHAVLKQLGAILEAGGASYANVVRTTVLLTDMGKFQKVNAVYAQYFDGDPPARMAYGVAALPFGAEVEIDAVAVVP